MDYLLLYRSQMFDQNDEGTDRVYRLKPQEPLPNHAVQKFRMRVLTLQSHLPFENRTVGFSHSSREQPSSILHRIALHIQRLLYKHSKIFLSIVYHPSIKMFSPASD